MKKKQFKLLSILSIFVLLILAACGSNDGDSSSDGDTGKKKEDYKFLSLLTGGVQGTYYPLGGTFAELMSEETGIKTTAEVSQASATIIASVKQGTAEIAFT